MYILWNTNVGMLNMISLKCVHWGPVDHDEESVLSGNDTYVVTRPQWVNIELIGGALSGMVVVIPVQHFKRVGPKANDIFSIKTEFAFEKCMVNDAYYLLQTASADSHYGDATMGAIASQITSLTVVYSTVYSDADQRKHQSSASLAFAWGIHRDRWIPSTNGQ